MTPLDRLTHAVDELTRPRSMRQPYTYRSPHGTLITTEHIVNVVSLLEQLHHTPLLETLGDNNGLHTPPGSRPAGSLERLAALETIRREATRLNTYMHGPTRNDLDHILRGLIGVATMQDTDTQEHLATTSHRWLSLAWSVTGWNDPPFRPDNKCPLCEARHSLRVRVITASDVHASCCQCGEVWTPDTINVLIAHIRWENDELEATA